jgi:hypothetical protein
VSGTLVVRQDLLNELIAKWLQNQALANAPPVDANRLKTFVKSATVRAEPGTVLLDFDVRL